MARSLDLGRRAPGGSRPGRRRDRALQRVPREHLRAVQRLREGARALFTVDRAAGRVTDADGNTYSIVPVEGALPAAEPAILASGVVAGPASETILIGERSFVSSHVSIAPARVSVQVGTCEGLGGRLSSRPTRSEPQASEVHQLARPE
jgi:hypothetical protein